MTTYHDGLGNAFSAASGSTAEAVEDFVGGFLAYEPRALRVAAAADADPASGLAQVYAAAVQMLGETPQGPRLAAPYLLRADAALRPSDSARERGALAFVQAWAEERIPDALAIGEAVVADHPRDLALVKLHQYLSFNLGDVDGMLRIAALAEPGAADAAALHGMKSFALEQSHLIDEAEASAKTAIKLKPREPWAQHTLAHVALSRGGVADGAAFLESVEDGWTGLNSFMSTHLYWHLGLFYLSQGRDADLLALYDRHVWGVAPGYSQDQVNAISLLARMEMAGIAVGDRWQALAPYLATRRADTVLPFLSLQYLYGLARAGRAAEAEALRAAILERARTAPVFARSTWSEVAVPAADAMLAHAVGDMEGAVRGLARALPKLTQIGGSHAQRDLFELIYLDALQRSGRWSEARRILETRRRFDPDGKPLNRALARAYHHLGLPEQAAAAQACR